MKLKDLTGQRFGKLTVINRAESKIDGSGKRRTMWNCICDCGNSKTVLADYLKQAAVPSCGCEAVKNRINKNRVNNIGEKYGRLTIIDIIWNEKPTKVVCKCDCDNDYIGVKSDIVSGHTQSCGCLQSEQASLCNTKDWSGYVAESGVKLIKQYRKNDKGQWLWECECPICGNTFYELPAKVNNGHTTSCGCRIQSFGESYVQSILQSMNIQFILQYTFDNCKYVYVLHFDFAIIDDKGVIGLIEYDGKQHFEPIEFFGGEDGFNKTKRRDEIKNTYCKTNNIPLLRIPYTLSLEEIKHKLYEYYLSLTTAGCA